MIDIPLKLKIIQLLEYQFEVREIIFGVMCILFLNLSWRLVCKIFRKKHKLMPPLFWPEDIEALAKIMKEDGESEEAIKEMIKRETERYNKSRDKDG